MNVHNPYALGSTGSPKTFVSKYVAPPVVPPAAAAPRPLDPIPLSPISKPLQTPTFGFRNTTNSYRVSIPLSQRMCCRAAKV